jgi:hypothetical protein
MTLDRSHSSLLLALLLIPAAGCSSSGASATGGDAGPLGDGSVEASPDTGAPGPDGPVVINASKHNTVLGRPTDASIAVSVLADAAGDAAWIEYGTQLDAAGQSVVAGQKSAAVKSAKGEPIVVDLAGLSANAKYYYRVHYQPGGAGDDVDAIHSFHTQRAAGSTFHFGVQGDSHPERYDNKMFHAELYGLTMQQVRDRQPDLYFMLGDDFSIEEIIAEFKTANYAAGYSFTKSVDGALPYAQYQSLAHPFVKSMLTDGEGAPRSNAAYLEQREKYLGVLANATSLMLVNGNHEETRRASLGGIFNDSAVWAADGRLAYYPLPAPGAFYGGDAEKLVSVNGYPTLAAPDGLLRDYYAFEWGDALFVTIDPYWHAPEHPETNVYNGDKANAKNLWNATMGDVQYQWLKQTLEGSRAKWKFVFTHHINGTGRGGVASVGQAEWGGPVADFKTNRPTWAKPIHQLLVDTHVTIFFQAHDHMFARETVDGVVYQEVPNPADNSYFAYNCDAYAPASLTWQGPTGYGKYDPATAVRMPNTGFLDVSVSADAVKVDYVRTYRAVDLSTNPNKIFTGKEVNGETAFSYSVPAQPGDSQPKDFAYTCIGAAPPTTWVYNP